MIAELQPKYYDGSRAEMLNFVPADIKTLLDVGCGSGGFLQQLAHARPEILTRGLEPNVPAALRAAESGLDVSAGTFPEAIGLVGDRKYDCITFNDVLEHLVDPWAALDAAGTILAPGGVIVASLPNICNVATLFEVLSGDFRYVDQGVLDRTHLRFFTPASAERMFSERGYSVVSTKGINALRSRRARYAYLVAAPLFKGVRRYGKFRQFVVVASCG